MEPLANLLLFIYYSIPVNFPGYFPQRLTFPSSSFTATVYRIMYPQDTTIRVCNSLTIIILLKYKYTKLVSNNNKRPKTSTQATTFQHNKRRFNFLDLNQWKILPNSILLSAWVLIVCFDVNK